MSRAALFPALVLSLAALALASLAIGDRAIPLAELLGALSGDRASAPASAMIVLDLRLPRVVLAALAGAALGAAGAVAQTVMRNPLAEPGLLGINAGAAVAALAGRLWFQGLPASLTPWFAFAGALGMAAAIWVLSWRGGTSSIRIILVGIGLNAMAGAAAAFISLFAEITALQRMQAWLAGTVAQARWETVWPLAAWTLPGLALALAASRELDLLAFGAQTARALGQRAQLAAGLAVALCALLAAAAVAAVGPVAFVGLIAPHLARRLAGPSHLARLPAAAGAGALLLMAADLAGRTAIAPTQIPAGLLTTLIGAPFFAWLLWRGRHA